MSNLKLYISTIIICVFLPLITSALELPADYQSKTAIEKQDIIWNNIEAGAYAKKLPTKPVSGFDILKLFQVNFLTPSISHESDEMPTDRKRLIHTYGTLAKITYKPIDNSTDYTGLFKCTVPGIIRASVVQYNPKNLMPGIAIKFFVDGKSSLNTHALHTIDGQGKDFNYFKYSFSNIIPQPKSSSMKKILEFFTEAAKIFTPDGSATKVSLAPLSKIDINGLVVSTPKSPVQIFFQPSNEAQQDSKDNRDFRIKLNELEPGIKLFDVFVSADETSNKKILVGEILLDSKFIASIYGDQTIFFQHLVK